MSDNSLIAFKAISNFTNDLFEVFGDLHRPLKLYSHLINKTTISHDKAIQKHIEAFTSFCIANRDAISKKNIKDLSQSKISYSERVYIDMKDILKHSDLQTTETIWKHLLTISALVDPTGKAREILKEQANKEDNNGGELDFLSNIISKVEEKVDPNSNPMEAVSSIMQSGIFTDLVNGMGNGLQDGSLDLSKLMGTVQNMVTKLSDDAGDKEGGEQAVNMINTMMGSLNAGATQSDNKDSQPMPDLVGMLGPMMGAMMGGMGGMGGNNMSNMMNINNSNSNSIEETINKQVEAAKNSGELQK